MDNELKHIKKLYGEQMMHFCRMNFPTILNTEGLLLNILRNNFNERKDLYDDLLEYKLLNEFENYIDYIDNPDKNKWLDTGKSPYDLLKEVGYTLYECKTKKDIDYFKFYYEENEMLCTFDDEYRLDSYYVFFIVKDNAHKLERNNFRIPKRGDEYSLSVLSIQFKKSTRNTKVKIISRYNHSVKNPDATLDNNLESIIPGLSNSFKNYFNLNFNRKEESFSIPGYKKDSITNKYYKANIITDSYAFCPNNIILTKHGVVDTFSKENNASFILMDGYLLDLIHKRFISFYYDSFISDLQDIKNIDIINLNSSNKLIKIITNNLNIAYIVINKNNEIIQYINNNITEIKDHFMVHNKKLELLQCNNVVKIGNNFLINNKKLDSFYFPNVEIIGNNILNKNIKIKDIYAPNVTLIGNDFCPFAYELKVLNIFNVIYIGDNFLLRTKLLRDINLPNIEEIGNNFLSNNFLTDTLNADKLEKCGDSFLYASCNMHHISINNLKNVGDDFFYSLGNKRYLLLKNIIINKVRYDIKKRIRK